MRTLLLLVCFAGLVSAEAEAEADPACNNCGQRPPYIKGARVSNFNTKLVCAGNFISFTEGVPFLSNFIISTKNLIYKSCICL